MRQGVGGDLWDPQLQVAEGRFHLQSSQTALLQHDKVKCT